MNIGREWEEEEIGRNRRGRRKWKDCKGTMIGKEEEEKRRMG